MPRSAARTPLGGYSTGRSGGEGGGGDNREYRPRPPPPRGAGAPLGRGRGGGGGGGGSVRRQSRLSSSPPGRLRGGRGFRRRRAGSSPGRCGRTGRGSSGSLARGADQHHEHVLVQAEDRVEPALAIESRHDQ